ncbi:hypothetical protein AB4144_34695, partial [Rhizobiaceae sp. 2RAB30]
EWRAIAPGIEIVELDADHYTIMRPPATDAIATRIADAMVGADSETHVSSTRTAARKAAAAGHPSHA